MGVQGLTSYVNQKSDVYFESHKLSDCILIIDGYGLASQLYNSFTKINSAFGGDYDKYCKLISKFMGILRRCKIIPLVICDGGYEKKKLATVKRRNVQRMYFMEKVSPSCNNLQCFPLMLRHVFKETLLKLSIPVFQTDFEADNEIAALSKKLNAPVLSNDSDFLIYDVHYIPLTSVAFDHCESNGHCCYVPCKIFCVNNLLKSFGNLPKTMLPLLATVLGNDYIKSSEFKEFYSHLKMDKSKKLKPGQKRVKGVVSWLKGETFESAMFKILQCSKKKNRRNAKKSITNVINGYTNLNSTLDSYLPDYITNKQSCVEVFELTNSFKSSCFIESSGESDSENECARESLGLSSEESDSEDDTVSEIDDVSSDSDDEIKNPNSVPKNELIPSWLLNESRVGNMCPSVNTLLLLKVYFFCPQVEDYECAWAGSIALPILQVIIGLLGLSSITYWYRLKCRYVSSRLLSTNSIFELNFPELRFLNMLPESEKKLIILKTLNIENVFALQGFPLEWQLFVMSIVYWVKTSQGSVKYWHLNALIITLITVNVIGEKVGSYWHKKTFLKRYGSKLKSIEKNEVTSKNLIKYENIIEALENVTFDDCLVALDCLIPYFHIDKNLNRNSKKFSRSIVHSYAQLQSAFEMSVTLNSLLSQPFKRCHLGKLYNGTFLYNFTVNFKSRTNILTYMQSLIGKAPSVLSLFNTIYNSLILLVPDAPKQVVKGKRHKKRKEINEVNSKPSIEEASGSEDFNDCNNPYSLLSRQINTNR